LNDKSSKVQNLYQSQCNCNLYISIIFIPIMYGLISLNFNLLQNTANSKNKFKMKYYVCFVVFLITTVFITITTSIEVIYAVNCGGDQYTDSNGIFYTKDIQTEGVSFAWFNVAGRPPINFGGVTGNDKTIYNIARTTEIY
jgi:hypothetical protein